MVDHAPVQNYTEGLKAIRNALFLQSPRWHEQQLRANHDGAHESIVTFERAFIKRMAKLGVPMFAHCVVRSAAAQNALFVKGYSKARAGQSAHNYGCAVDIVHSVKAWSMSTREWTLIGHIGKEVAASLEIPLTWGGDWDFYDPAHWEIRNWRSIPHVKFGHVA